MTRKPSLTLGFLMVVTILNYNALMKSLVGTQHSSFTDRFSRASSGSQQNLVDSDQAQGAGTMATLHR